MSSRRIIIGWVLGVLLAAGLLALIPLSANAASPGDLCLYGSDVSTDTGEAMMPGTSPAITELPGGNAAIAFQGANQHLDIYTDTTGSLDDTGSEMDPDSSPALTVTGNAVVLAFNAAGSDELWTGNAGAVTASGQYAAPGTSPAVVDLYAASPVTSEFAYIDTNDNLVVGNGSTWSGTGLGAAAHSSVAMGGLGNGSYELAFEAADDSLWEYTPSSGGTATGQAMNPGAAPSIAGLSSDFDIAYETDANELNVWGNNGSAPPSEAMAPSTNPSLAEFASGSQYDIAYQGTNGDLWVNGASTGTMDTGHAMAPGTSPALTQTSAGYEVAYQCAAPAAAPITPSTGTTTPAPTPVTSTTPSSSAPAPTHTSAPRLNALFAFRMNWYGHSSHTTHIDDAQLVTKLPKGVRKLPRNVLITFTCEGTKRYPCPRLGTLAHRKRTLAKELAVVAGRTFGHNDVLVITIAAKGYATETIGMHMSGTRAPTYKRSWK